MLRHKCSMFIIPNLDLRLLFIDVLYHFTAFKRRLYVYKIRFVIRDQCI